MTRCNTKHPIWPGFRCEKQPHGNSGYHQCGSTMWPAIAGIPPLGTTPIKPDETPFDMPKGYENEVEDGE